MLALLPHDQVRALMSTPTAFVSRTGRGPQSLSTLRRVLADERRQGYSVEDGEVVPGYASVAVAVVDSSGAPIASVSVTFRAEGAPLAEPVAAALNAAGVLAAHLAG